MPDTETTTTTPSELVLRCNFKSYMNTAAASETTPTWTLIGEGFTSLKEAKNPTEYSRKYVHERTERTDVVGYATQIDYTTDTYTENPVIAKIAEVTDKELTGTDAQVEILNVNEFQDSGSSGTHAYKAYKRTYAIIPDAKGDGTDALVYSGSFKAVGDIISGTFSGTAFTADT